MKKLYSLILCLIFLCGCLPPALAADAPVFSSLAYLSEEAAASRLAYYTGATPQTALSQVKAAQTKASGGAGMLGERMSPAYLYLQTDLGGGKLLEQGAIVIVRRKNGALEFAEVVGAYSRPVNSDLRFTPDGATTASISDKTRLTLSTSGTASVTLPADSDGQTLLDAGFTAAPDGRAYNKRTTLSAAYGLTEAIPLGESDMARGYFAMLDAFRQTTGIDPKDYPRIALELKTPVGLNATAKQTLLGLFTESNGVKAIETTMEDYFAAYNGPDATANTPADYFFQIDNVTVQGNTIRFKIGGYRGSSVHILSDCAVTKGANGWVAVNTAPPGSEAGSNPMIDQKVS